MMCMIAGTDHAVLLNEQTRTSRKKHQCSECRRVISKGEAYRYEVTLFDGEVRTHKTCRHCLVVRGWLDKACGGWVYGMVYSDFRKHVIWIRPIDKGRARVLLSMKRGWKKRNGQLMPVPHLEEETHGATG